MAGEMAYLIQSFPLGPKDLGSEPRTIVKAQQQVCVWPQCWGGGGEQIQTHPWITWAAGLVHKLQGQWEVCLRK